MSSQLNSRSAGLMAISLVWAAFLTIIGSPEVLLFTVPVFMLAAPLALGRYAGEGLIGKLSRVTRQRVRPAPGAAGRFFELPGIVSGSPLIALNLAGRAPPASAA